VDPWQRRRDWREARREWHSARRAWRGGGMPLPIVWTAVALAWAAAGWWHGGAAHSHWQPAVFFVLAIGTVVFAFVTARFTRRLERLRRAAESISLRDLSVRVEMGGSDAVADLAASFNRMLDRLAGEERARRQLFADVAHELRHPLAVLRGRIESMQDGAAPLEPGQLLLLQDEVIGLTRLVGDLRDLSLADVGQLSLHLAEVDVPTLVGQLRESMEPVAEARRIALTATLEGQIPALRADPDRLRQVMLNLLTNAVHYTPAGGSVALAARREGPDAVLEVTDTGPGIDAKDMPHVFDRFYRADRARARASGGTGLGLAIVRSLVELHGGTVSADSSPSGSRFTVRLPLAGRQT